MFFTTLLFAGERYSSVLYGSTFRRRETCWRLKCDQWLILVFVLYSVVNIQYYPFRPPYADSCKGHETVTITLIWWHLKNLSLIKPHLFPHSFKIGYLSLLLRRNNVRLKLSQTMTWQYSAQPSIAIDDRWSVELIMKKHSFTQNKHFRYNSQRTIHSQNLILPR